ncbi:hypothetical protein ABZ366_25315, partial [Streptomyces sp. NPDC005904]
VTQRAPGTPAPGTPAPGNPGPSTPTPGTPAPGTPTPGTHTPPALYPAYTPQAVHIGPQQASAEPKRRGRAGVWAGTLAAAFVIGGGATAGILIWQDNADDKAGDAGKNGKPAASRSGEPSQEPSPVVSQEPPGPESSDSSDTEASGGGEDSEVPAGSERVTDSEGFSFAVPTGWTRQTVNPERPGQITYADPTGREQFLVGVVVDAPYTSYENFTNIEDHTKSASDKSDYRRIQLERNTFRGRDGALWEYTYTDEVGRTIHALNQSYIAENGTEYAIQLSWREDFWSAGEGAQTHRTALRTWRLTGD